MEYEILSLNDQGKGICYVNNKITFVDNAVPGDIINLEIIKETKKYNIAKVTKYIKESKDKIKSFCPYYKTCGGCNLSTLKYEYTLLYKKQKLEHILKKFANQETNIDIIPSDKYLNYRNKITLKVKNGIIGYYEEKTNDIVEINKCMLAKDAINNFIKYIKDTNIKNGEVVIRCNYNDELLVNFITEDPIILPIIKDLKIVGILKNSNILQGDNKFIEIINNKYYQVSYDSFFQINNYIASIIFDTINKYITPKSNIIDLYCGVGTLGISTNSNKVYGIEIIPNAIINALTNAKINKVNANYMLGDATNILPKINDKIDSIICDPPRSGLTKEIINTIKDNNIKQIIYLSCDPITLARDIKLLSDKYIIKNIKGFDMFPYTYHIETLCILERY